MLSENNSCLLPLTLFETLKNKLRRIVEPLAQAEKLTIMQVHCLLLISQEEMTIGSLSEQLTAGQANTSTLCKKLEKAGYITRVRAPEDERVVKLALTGQGEETLERIRQHGETYFKAMSQVPDTVREDLRRGIAAADYVLDFLYNHKEA